MKNFALAAETILLVQHRCKVGRACSRQGYNDKIHGSSDPIVVDSREQLSEDPADEPSVRQPAKT
jgi:hypothetical protein